MKNRRKGKGEEKTYCFKNYILIMDITRSSNSMGPFALKPLAEKRLMLPLTAMLCTVFHNLCCTQLYPMIQYQLNYSQVVVQLLKSRASSQKSSGADNTGNMSNRDDLSLSGRLSDPIALFSHTSFFSDWSSSFTYWAMSLLPYYSKSISSSVIQN